MKLKIFIFLVSLIFSINPVLADNNYGYNAGDIFNPVIDSAAKTFNIDSYFILSILAVVIIILAIIFATTLIKKILFEPFKNRNVLNSNISGRRIRNVDPNLDITEFKNFSFESLKEYFESFSQFNYENLKGILSDSLYKETESELESLEQRNLKNIISNIKMIYCQINNVKITNGTEIVDVILTAQFKNYIVNYNDIDVVVSGSKRDVQEKTYLLTFIKEELHTACVKCGGEVQDNRCLYCRAVNTQKENSWIISKMKILKQHTLGK